MSFIPFFGSALQVTPHFHSLVPDGVFVPEEGGVRFEALPPPTQGEVERLLKGVWHRVLRLLEKRGALPAQGPEDARLLRRLGVRLMGSPSASLTSRSAPARYAQEGSCPSYAPPVLPMLQGPGIRSASLTSSSPSMSRYLQGRRVIRGWWSWDCTCAGGSSRPTEAASGWRASRARARRSASVSR